MYHPPENIKKKKVNIPTSNISTSPTKLKKTEKPRILEEMPFQYSNGRDLEKLDFVKMFIVEELLYYINKTVIIILFREKEQRKKWSVFVNSIMKTLMMNLIL